MTSERTEEQTADEPPSDDTDMLPHSISGNSEESFIAQMLPVTQLRSHLSFI